MTTIAIKKTKTGWNMAADTRSCSPEGVCKGKKIHKIGPNHYIGCAGELVSIHKFKLKLTDPEKNKDIDIENQEFYILEIKEDEARLYERSSTPIPIYDDYKATGSGGVFALSAMALGKSAKQAVEFAVKLDIHSGLERGIDECQTRVRKRVRRNGNSKQ